MMVYEEIYLLGQLKCPAVTEYIYEIYHCGQLKCDALTCNNSLNDIFKIYLQNIRLKYVYEIYHCGQLEWHVVTKCLISKSCFGGLGRPITAP